MAEAVAEAVERLRDGEQGVRLEPASFGRSARLASRFNAAVAALENREPRTTQVDHDLRLFDILRDPRLRDDQPDALKTFVGVLEPDRFAQLRESVGYNLANSLMAKLAARLAFALPTAQVGRVGRTTIEFAFSAADSAAAASALEGCARVLEQRVEVDGLPFDLSVKFGFTDAGGSSIRDELVDQAAAALLAAQSQRTVVQFADRDILTQTSMSGVELMRRLPAAMAAGELHLAFQPKLHARDHSIPAAEALLRWDSPDLGSIAPDRFISVAEETGAIRDLTYWVIERAVADQAAMAAAGFDIDVYVNISGVLLPDRDFSARALALLEKADGKICFEITETAVISDPEATLENLAAFSGAGIKLAIDDYGSGLSSLSYLKQLPADELKIDKQFVSGLTQTNRDPLLVRSSIDLAHALEMQVTAEGVDDPMALSLLTIMGCDLLQGFLIAAPMPLAALLQFLRDGEYRERLAAGGNAFVPLRNLANPG